MDKHQIGVNAGKVWKLLNDNKRWSYCDLKRASELSDRFECIYRLAGQRE